MTKIKLFKMSYPPPYIINAQPGYAHTHTIILLHGRSSTAKEFANDLFSLKSSTATQNLPSHFPNCRWVFPDAGERWCTQFKEKRSAWCDTFSLDDLSKRQDLQVVGLRDGVHLVRRVIEEEVEKLGGKSNKIILGGFSQGSATALWSLFTGAALSGGSLGAFVGLSAWMPFTNEAKTAVGVDALAQRVVSPISDLVTSFLDILGIDSFISTEGLSQNLQRTPVYLGHGTDDVPVSVTNCHELTAVFQGLGVKVEAREYTGAGREGHWVKEPEQLDDIVRFLKVQTASALS